MDTAICIPNTLDQGLLVPLNFSDFSELIAKITWRSYSAWVAK